MKTTTKKAIAKSLNTEIELVFKGSEPFIVNDDGFPLGVLISRTRDQKVLCFLCGKWWSHLSSHIAGTHKMTSDEYKEMFGFNQSAGLVSRPLSENMSKHSKKLKKQGKTKNPPKSTKKASNRMQRKNALNTCPAQYIARYRLVENKLGRPPKINEMDKHDSGVSHYAKKQFRKNAWAKFQEAIKRTVAASV